MLFRSLALNVGATFESATCEIIGARIVNLKNTGPNYRALRCLGADFTEIEEPEWARFTHVTTPEIAAARLAVIAGRPQLPPADVKRIAQSLENKSACPAQPMLAAKDQLLLGLRWFDGPAEPLVPNDGPVVSGRY